MHRGIKARGVCLPWVAPGSADAPRHQLRAGLEVLLIEGYAGTKVHTAVRPATNWGWRPMCLPWRERSCLKFGSLGPPSFFLKGRACEFMRLMYGLSCKDLYIGSRHRSGATLRGVILAPFGVLVGLPVCWAPKQKKMRVAFVRVRLVFDFPHN